MTTVPWLDDDELAAWRGWLTLAARVRTAVERDMVRDHSMSGAEYAVLVHLSEAPDHRVRMNDLAGGLGWSKSRVSHLVARMDARGLLTREGCPTDARGCFAALTGAGLAEIALAAPAHVASVRRHFLDHLERDQVRQLADLTASALARMDAAAACTTTLRP